MYADERGSPIGSTLNDGTNEWVTIYDEYGRTAPGHGAFRHGYAGQVLIGSGLSFARNRVYSLNLGRFLQTDPIGYGAGMNMYNYAASDPVNFLDPSGLLCEPTYYSYYRDTNRDGVRQKGEPLIGTPWSVPDTQCLQALAAQFNDAILGGPGGGGGPANPPGPQKTTPPPPAPPPPQDNCFSRNSYGQCTQRRAVDGNLYLDPDYAKVACRNYHAMMRSNAQVGGIVAVGSGTSFLKGLAGKTAGVIGYVVGGTIAALALSPAPPGCE
jgi:RHS repeat-associated protein